MIYGTASACILFSFLLVGIAIGLYLMFRPDDKSKADKR
jgi:hypothetical protein